MFIYFFLLIVSYILSFTTKKYKNISFAFLCVLLLFVGFFRSQSVGTDNSGYCINFQACSMNPLSWSAETEMEPGFSWFMAFFKTYICNDYEIFMGVEFLVFMAGTIFLIKKYSSNCCLSLFFLILLLYYTLSFNMMRQSCAISLSFFLFPLLLNPNKKNFLFYILGILFVSFYVHRSLFVMLLLPFVYRTKLIMFFNKKKNVYILLLLSMFVFSFLPFFFSFIDKLGNAFSFLGARYVAYIQTASDLDMEGRVTTSFLNVLLKTLLALFVVYVTPPRMHKSPFYICFVLGVVLMNCLSGFNVTFIRLATNFMIYSIVFFPILWNIVEKKYYIKLNIVVLLISSLFFIHSMRKGYDGVVPYECEIFK